MSTAAVDFVLMWFQAWLIMLIAGVGHAQTGEIPALSYVTSLAIVVCVNVLMITNRK